MNREKEKQATKARRKARAQARGTAVKPRLSVFRSLNAIYAQIIDDESGKTLAAASSREIKNEKAAKTEIAVMVGRLLAEKAKKTGITTVVFDRGGFKFHGRVKALADGAREGGLKF